VPALNALEEVMTNLPIRPAEAGDIACIDSERSLGIAQRVTFPLIKTLIDSHP